MSAAACSSAPWEATATTFLRSIPADFPHSTVREIDHRLDQVRSGQDAEILLAVESGSRAWGFASPDSDFDCRFLYVRPVEAYLSLSAPRDVIEVPLDPVFDINGWDLAKALKLLLKGNAAVVEWLQSPIVYSGSRAFREDVLAFARSHADRDLIARHYLHLGQRQRRLYFRDAAVIPLKKLFYALRPAVTLRWMRINAGAPLPPMHFPTAVASADLPPEIADLIADLLARKADTHEMGSTILPPAVSRFVDGEFEQASRTLGAWRMRMTEEAEAEADRLFRRWVLAR
ncbi:nucleotidyltransferase domain-containing protein [Segnochrobactraceae bacterium EtOH-i3]